MRRPLTLRTWLVMFVSVLMLASCSTDRLTDTPEVDLDIQASAFTSTLVVKHSDKCLVIKGDSTGNGAAAEQRACAEGQAFDFEFVPVSGEADTYIIVNKNSGKCLDVFRAKTERGTELVQYSCGEGDNQHFKLIKVIGNNYQLEVQHSEQCVDVFRARTADGTKVTQYTCATEPERTQQGNQVWKIAGVTNPPAPSCDYVVATNGNDRNPGTLERPFRSIEKGLEPLEPGNTLCVRSGRYPALEIEGLNGTSAKPITVRGYGDERPILDRNLTYADSTCDPDNKVRHQDCAVLYLNKSDYLTIDGFEFTDSDPRIQGDKVYNLNLDENDDNLQFIIDRRTANYGIRSSSDPEPKGIIMRNNEIHHVWRSGILGAFEGLLFQDNEVHHTGAYGTYITGENNRLENNRIHHTAGHGLRVGNGSNPFDNGTMNRNRIYDIGLGTYYHRSSDKVKTGGSGIIVWYGQANEVAYNSVRGSAQHGVRVKGCSNDIHDNTVTESGQSDYRIENDVKCSAN